MLTPTKTPTWTKEYFEPKIYQNISGPKFFGAKKWEILLKTYCLVVGFSALTIIFTARQ